MNKLNEATKKALTAQTSDQLYAKLKAGKLFGISQTIAVEILQGRKEKGKFDGDLTPFLTAAKPKADSKETKGADAAEKKVEKKVVEKKEPKTFENFPDFKLKFKKGQEVKFTPFRENKELIGTVISSYPYQPKKGDVREDVRIRVGEKTYVKNGNEVKVVK